MNTVTAIVSYRGGLSPDSILFYLIIKFIYVTYQFQLFVSRITDDVVSRGLKDCLSELGVDYVDCLILSVSESITVKELDAVWKQMEGEVRYQ